MAGPMRFGRYETLFRIASGGMAEVFAARVRGEMGFEKLVAVKRIVPHLAEDEAFVRMFLDEARLAANVSSPHVVQTLDLGRADDGSLYIAMELVVGVTLFELVTAAAERNQRLPVGIAVEIAAQAAEGLHDAHEARTPTGQPLEIVHRDVSPQNVLVGVDGRVKVTDFGIARAAGRLSQTEHGQLKGKLAYFSPEQSRAAPLDRRSDVFALGVVAWEMLASDRLFSGATPAEIILAVRRAQVPDLHALRPEVPPAVASVVAAALAREPADRPATAAELARRLRASAHDAGLAVGSAEIASWLGESRVARLGQLRDRIRAALETPDVSTLQDIELAPGATEPDAAQVASDASTAPRGEPAAHAARTVLLDGARRRRRRAWIGASSIAALTVLALVAYASGLAAREEPAAAASSIAAREPPTTSSAEPVEIAIPSPAIEPPHDAPGAHPAANAGAESEPESEAEPEAEPAPRRRIRSRRPPPPPPSDRRRVGPVGLDAFERGVQR